MVRIAGVNIPDKKRIDFSLPYIYGVGRSLAKRVLNEAKVDANKLTNALTAEEVNRIRSILEGNYQVEGDLKRLVSSNIKRLRDIKSYRGVRHMKGLPSKGQRTKTNSRTRRGNVRRTTISGKRKVEKK
ncbi:MAG: 30S ribosomal protein S13 [Candidatus Niyogibacteria bacterium RIFCSPLOWO2_01_FULL_45_48]|uniref:Small ribosomal subunit protein uS13 n=2 Tax=Candidatus Niyogiibacteriota TaxID=1817912 RepID=A0A1G2F0N8_9BACT|nr:MAG: 30S ribosomal protein S13 [Candidatus Niyogibacteria bacterium RIFCSPHIGHO2_01_FULL_45_28]OGZ29794.1 MAG: 30S ribosomal protein S13 [Candidatus Niyogibacteria bacterium RIFCSPLOWO2_01_FULL_45_48]OGZ31635.1 MAG: 30S ribosomal protein S13 [Candidatus Niyogibacteria bacterium RIFCSPLOWO2_02_FULL_45_13]